MKYEELLKRARDNLPESTKKTERFSIPKVKGHLQGTKTVLANFFQISDVLGRDPDHILKYILKELATSGDLKKPLVILKRKVGSSRINEKIEEYAKKYVICKVCSKPDSKFVKQDRILMVKCNACGARYPIN
jgi:translation initiation factor 2 subunit 2